MSNKSLIFFIVIFCCVTSYAQQSPHFTQYLYNQQIFNPAAVGSRSDLNISLLSRSQWVGLEGAPTTQTFALAARSRKGIGLGTSIIRDQIGLSESINTNVDISYTIITSEHTRLAFGLKGGATFFNNNLSEGITPINEVTTSNYETFQNTSGVYPNVGFGAYFYNSKYFFGLSVPYILKSPEFTIETTNVSAIANTINYFAIAGVRFKAGDNFMIKPSTLVKYTSNLPLSVDFNTNVMYKKIIETGLSYRYNDSMNYLFAIIIKEKYRIGYAYDHKFTDFGTDLNSHEIMLHIDLNLKRQGRWLQPPICYF